VSESPITFWQRFAWGAAGSFGYEIVRLYRISTTDRVLITPTHVAISVGLMIAAGIFSCAWEDNKAWKCFYLGVTFPLWIAAWSAAHTS
jgi:hypothetical protein